MIVDPHIAEAITSIRTALAGYTFRVRSEAELQVQVVAVLTERLPHVTIDTEVRSGAGRFDVALLVDRKDGHSGLIVLELKVKSSAAAVERQAQRYALMCEVDAVFVVTTSQRLRHDLEGWHQLGGKPFGAIAVRTS